MDSVAPRIGIEIEADPTLGYVSHSGFLGGLRVREQLSGISG